MHWSVKGLINLFSLLWHIVFYLILLPWLILETGKSLDWLVFISFWKLRLSASWAPVIFVVRVLGAGVIVVGVIVILKAWLDLAQKGSFFPLTTLAQRHLGPQKLVTTDIYAHVRHPMLLGYLLILWGLALVSFSFFTAVWIVPLFGYASVKFMEQTEERELLTWFGQEYKDYKESTPSLIPRFFKKPVN